MTSLPAGCEYRQIDVFEWKVIPGRQVGFAEERRSVLSLPARYRRWTPGHAGSLPGLNPLVGVAWLSRDELAFFGPLVEHAHLPADDPAGSRRICELPGCVTIFISLF